jgi:hypothetical protein
MLDKTINIEDKIESRASIIEYRSDGILQLTRKEVDEFNVDDVREADKNCAKISRNEKYVLLVISKSYVPISSEARLLAASKEMNKNTIAVAVLIDSIASKIVMNFYISFNKPVSPTKLFTSEDKAVEWLRTFL